MPDTPRWLDREATAQYIGVRVDHLPRLRRRGLLPEPSCHLGPRSPRWDRDALDAAFGAPVASRPRPPRDINDRIAAIAAAEGL